MSHHIISTVPASLTHSNADWPNQLAVAPSLPVNNCSSKIKSSLVNATGNQRQKNNRHKLYCALRRTKSLRSIFYPPQNKTPAKTKIGPQLVHKQGGALLALLAIAMASTQAHASTVFINELHYDNEGSDFGEGVEIAAPAGLDLDGWQLQFYNGSDGGIYKTSDLAGTFTDQFNGYGIVHVVTGSLQNGPADGVALIDSAGSVMEFLSYEGEVTATDGAANGLTSTDIGVAEAANFPLGSSLQRIGIGSQAVDFNWVAADASFGAANDNQQFIPATSNVPLPAGGLLFASALGSLLAAGKRLTRA